VVPISMVGLTFVFFKLSLLQYVIDFGCLDVACSFVKNMFYKSQTFNLQHKHLDICVRCFPLD
jgi:hypothetical protein